MIRRLLATLILALLPVAAGAQNIMPSSFSANAPQPVSFNNVGATLLTVSPARALVCGFHIFNNSGATAYVQQFNDVAANITLGGYNPPIQTQVNSGAYVDVTWPTCVLFGKGVVIASTTTATGNTGSSAGVTVTLFIHP